MSQLTFLLLSLLAILQAGLADFISPPANGTIGQYSQNQVYAEGSNVPINLSTSTDRIDVYLFQQGVEPLMMPLWLNKSQDDFPNTWTVDISAYKNQTLQDSHPKNAKSPRNVFYFEVWPAGAQKKLFWSHYFNVTYSTTEVLAQSTGTSTGPTQVPTIVPPPEATTTAPALTSPMGSSTPTGASMSASLNNNSGLSPGLIAGIVVAAVGGAAILLGAIAFFWRRSALKARRLHHDRVGNIGIVDRSKFIGDPGSERSLSPVEAAVDEPMQELHAAREPVQELSAADVRGTRIHEIDSKALPAQELLS